MVASLTFFQAILMGLIQGVTELFPISSLGHGVLVPALLGWHNLVNAQAASQSFFLAFLVALHVGTALGLAVYYRRTWRDIIAGLFRQLGRVPRRGLGSLWRLSEPDIDPGYRLLFVLAVATIPVGVVGLALEKKLRELFSNPRDAAIFLFINGIILLVGERLRRRPGRHAQREVVENMTAGQSLRIGVWQVFALLAGISRSGITMVAGLLSGFDHEEAANFSFLLATPVILLAGLLKLPELLGHLGDGVRAQALVGALCAMVAAYVATAFLTRWFATRTLRPFAIYSLVVGLLCVVRFA